MVWLGVSATLEITLKGHNIREVENYCSKNSSVVPMIVVSVSFNQIPSSKLGGLCNPGGVFSHAYFAYLGSSTSAVLPDFYYI